MNKGYFMSFLFLLLLSFFYFCVCGFFLGGVLFFVLFCFWFCLRDSFFA